VSIYSSSVGSTWETVRFTGLNIQNVDRVDFNMDFGYLEVTDGFKMDELAILGKL